MSSTSPMLGSRARIVEATRLKIWQCITELVNDLELQSRSEHWAVQEFLYRLNLAGLRHQWYQTGSFAGADHLYGGTVVVFDNPHDPCSLAYPSARQLFPRHSFEWRGLGYFYASPLMFLQEESNQIAFAADFGTTLYFGSSPILRDAFRRRLSLQDELFHAIVTENITSTGEAFKTYDHIARRLGLVNVARSVMNGLRADEDVNIGHSLHALPIDGTFTEEVINDRYSSTRRFISALGKESLANEIWTFESRDVGSSTSLGVSFHEAIIFRDRRFRLLTSAAGCARNGAMAWLSA